MHIGVIGSGRIGVMHAVNAAKHPGVTKVTLAARNVQRLEEAAQRVRAEISDSNTTVAITTDVAELLGQVTGVVIATSTPSHPALVRQAVAAHVPVLVEKPLALELDELESLAAELEAQPIPVMVAFQRRYDPAYQAVRKQVAEGRLGTVRGGRAMAHDRRQIDLDYIPHSGGIWRDMVIHEFDAIPWVLGDEVVEVVARGATLEEPTYQRHGDVDTAVVVLNFASGAMVTITSSRRNEAGQDVRLEVFGTKNTIGVGYDECLPVESVDPGAVDTGERYEDFIARFEGAFEAEMHHFIQVIEGKAENLTPPSAGIASLKIALAAAESVRTGLAVKLDK